MKGPFSILAVLSIASVLAAQTANPRVGFSDSANGERVDYIRYEEEPGLPSLLQTAVVRFEKDGTLVDLAGVVHLGDADYFGHLNEVLKDYDAAFYEMVGGRWSPETGAVADSASGLSAGLPSPLISSASCCRAIPRS